MSLFGDDRGKSRIFCKQRDSQCESLVPYWLETPAKGAYEAVFLTRSNRPKFGALIYFATAFALSTHFTFAAVQGDFGLFRRVEISGEADVLNRNLAQLTSEIAEMENLTRRLSDDYLDLDLLDQQARSVLGLLRADEIVIR
jgi:cell division protein FtsB